MLAFRTQAIGDGVYFRAMRILHVVTAFPRSPDDAILPWLVELITRLQSLGLEVEVFTTAYKGGGGSQVRGITVHRFRYFFRRWENLTHEETAPDRMRRSLLYRMMPASYVLGGIVAMWRLCRRRRFDIVHVHWPLPNAIFGWTAQRASSARVVTSYYGVELRWVRHSMPLLRWFLAHANRTSDRVVAISHDTAREVQQVSAVPIEVIPYSMGLATDDRPAGVKVRRPGEALSILFVGRLVERKGVAVLIDALGLLRPALDVRVVVVGEGSERPVLEAKARQDGLGDRVTFTGRVSDAALREAYADADVFVLPAVVDSRGDTEGLGVVLLEAMNYNVPVVASDIGGITDIVRDGKTGLLVPPGDAAALADAIRRLATDPAFASALGRAGRAHLQAEFSWPAIVRRWLAVYASLSPLPDAARRYLEAAAGPEEAGVTASG